MSSISESKYQNRGPLIAVIKIQLDSSNVDRIFLHSKDNDEDLADEFVEKHRLNPMLKKHIFERIQMSRQAVDKNKLQFDNDQENNWQDYENDSFTTPMPKRDLKFEQSSPKKLISPLPKNIKDKQKKIQPYITYDDSQEGGNDTFEQKYHGSFSHNNLKHFDEQKRSKYPFEKDEYAAQQQPNRALNDSSTYGRDKYKNLYDVSGLKLKSSYPSFSNENSSIQAPNKYPIEEYTSSESSKGLFEKQLSNQKVLESNTSNDFIRESRVPEFREVTESYHQNHQTFNKSIPVSKPKTWKQKDAKIIQFKSSQYSQNKPFSAMKNQNQTKFSSIQKSSESDFMDLNYISFNKPYKEVPSEIQHKNPIKYQEESIGSYEKQIFDNSNETNSKKVGSIRSNAKTLNETQNIVKSHHKVTSHNYPSTPYLDLQSTTKFSQQKLFKNIKEIHNTRDLQQNRQINTETSRPMVKFYNKEEMKSLKQSNLSKSMSKAQLSRINAEVTSRLYNEAEIKKKYIDTLKARAKNLKEEELQDIQQMRQKPQINMLSKILAENRIKENKKIQDYLIDQGKILQLKRQQMASRQAKKQLEECSFRPQINEQSYRLTVLQRSRQKSRISNHSEIKCSKRTYNNQSTFHPEINRLSNEIAKGKGNFNERQHAFLQEKNCNMFKKLQQQRMKEKTDQISGQKLFQPQLSQRTLKLAQQSIYKNRQNKPIHSYLYQLSKVPKIEQKLDPKPQINPESQKLIQQLHEKRLNWLFLQLDNDEDGIISSKKICIDQIPTQILQIIAPVLYEMEELNTELNIDDFKNAIKNLNKGLDPYQKSILYNYNYSAKMIRT